MQTLEEQVTELQNTNSSLVAAVNSLTANVNGKIQAINKEVNLKKTEVDTFLANAQPEPRIVQDITIGGSKDYFYPVWWIFPENDRAGGKLTISRCFNWNGEIDERPLNPDGPQQASLLLETEGNANKWGGDAKFMEIKRFHYSYNKTISHVHFAMYCKARKIDPSKPSKYVSNGDQLSPRNYSYSGCYLRGGGLKYRIIKNWRNPVSYNDGSSMDAVSIRKHTEENFEWYAEPIPLADVLLPNEDINAFVDKPVSQGAS